MHRRRLIAIAVALLVVVAAQPAAADPGDLDPSLSGDGIRLVHVVGEAVGSDVAVQDDGRIVVAGGAGSPKRVVIARLLPNGRPDETFSGDGRASVTIPDHGFHVGRLAILPSGRIVIAGAALRPEEPFRAMVIVLRPNGSVDPDFGGGDGVVLRDLSPMSSDSEFVDVAPGGDGTIVATGYARVSGDRERAVVARFRSGGALDPSFSDDGVVLASGPTDSSGAAVETTASGAVIVAGTGSVDDSDGRTVLFRYTPDGAPDADFGGGDGWIAHDLSAPGEDAATSLTRDAATGRLVAGIAFSIAPGKAPTDFAVARFTSAGRRDTTFAGDGLFRRDWAPAEEASDVAIEDGGAVLATGLIGEVPTIVRLRESGEIASGFGDGGRAAITYSWEPSYPRVQAIELQDDGRIVVGGTADAALQVARLLS